jgi:hypothetical protein
MHRYLSGDQTKHEKAENLLAMHWLSYGQVLPRGLPQLTRARFFAQAEFPRVSWQHSLVENPAACNRQIFS